MPPAPAAPPPSLHCLDSVLPLLQQPIIILDLSDVANSCINATFFNKYGTFSDMDGGINNCKLNFDVIYHELDRHNNIYIVSWMAVHARD
jgi:hypothetical protein